MRVIKWHCQVGKQSAVECQISPLAHSIDIRTVRKVGASLLALALEMHRCSSTNPHSHAQNSLISC